MLRPEYRCHYFTLEIGLTFTAVNLLLPREHASLRYDIRDIIHIAKHKEPIATELHPRGYQLGYDLRIII